MKSFVAIVLVAMFAAVLLVGCGGSNSQQVSADTPIFSLAWSEYPSWSVFGVAQDKGLIGQKGAGTIERKYGIIISLKQADYDACLTLYGNGTVDANCQTNIDSLHPAQGRNSVMIMPTSTSVGADACIAVNFNGNVDKQSVLDFLKTNPTFGLEKSVSQYVFERNLMLMDKNLDLSNLSFRNMDPAAAAQAMQTGQPNVNSIMVWHPFVLQTLRTRKDSKVLFDSASIPEEVIDSIVVGKDVLSRPKGKEFAQALIETYFEVCKMMEDPKTTDETYVALGAKFSNLNAADMRIVCQQTRFYNTPEKGLALMRSQKFRNETTPMVTEFCLRRKMIDNKPTIGFNDPSAQLNFDDSYLKDAKK
jgi:ABC-type nitrate/sulfonate/bicarbonate transport system substrate-binding protein